MGTLLYGKPVHVRDDSNVRHLVKSNHGGGEGTLQAATALCRMDIWIIPEGRGSPDGAHPLCEDCREVAETGQVNPLEWYGAKLECNFDKDGDPLSWTPEQVEEARQKLDELQKSWVNSVGMLREFRERRLWKRLGMGYKSFAEFANEVLKMSPGRVSQLIGADTALKRLTVATSLAETHNDQLDNKKFRRLNGLNLDKGSKYQLYEFASLSQEQLEELASRVNFATMSVREIHQMKLGLANGPGVETTAVLSAQGQTGGHLCTADPNAWDYCPHCGERLRP